MWRIESEFFPMIQSCGPRHTMSAGCSRSMESGRQVAECRSLHGTLCRIVRYSPSNGTAKGIARLGIGWYFGEDQTDLSCSIRSAHFADMHGPTLAVSSRNGLSLLARFRKRLHS